MKESSLEQKIDHVFFTLRLLYHSGIGVEKEKLWELVTIKPNTHDINRILFEGIVNKLLEDGYIQKTTKHSNTHTIYNLTLKGTIFLGYVHQVKKENEEKIKIKELENKTEKLQNDAIENANRLNKLTFWLVIGTSIAAIYYIIEIIKSLFFPK